MITIQIPLDDLVSAIVERLGPIISSPDSDDVKTTEYLSRSQVCEMLGITKPTLTAHMKQGKIKAYRIGRRVLFKAHEVEESLKQIKIL